ncbi:MAG: rRNA maturation RNase YbeY [Bacteroidales bacterium]|nr:rRNA maturation RNase YbeY [Bacteroidales bacterium]
MEFLCEDIEFNLTDSVKIENWINECIELEGKEAGEITYIFCSDPYILEINKEHLQHDYFTDIITFDYCFDDIINGDMFISIDTVKDNAERFNQSFEQELCRVVIHGILHLIGYNDSNDEEQRIMSLKEDFYLGRL